MAHSIGYSYTDTDGAIVADGPICSACGGEGFVGNEGGEATDECESCLGIGRYYLCGGCGDAIAPCATIEKGSVSTAEIVRGGVRRIAHLACA